MVFVSDTFLFVFLPIFLLVYFVAPAHARNGVILVSSAIFYGWWRYDYLLILICIALNSWATGLWISRTSGLHRRLALWFAVSGPLLALLYFKYANLIITSAISLGAPIAPWSSIALPIGLSFFVFGAVSYSVDVYRRTVSAEPSLINYAAYQAMFGHLVAGPIVRYQTVAARLRFRIFNFEEFTEGARRFMVGFAQKVIVADTLAPLSDYGFSLPGPSLFDAALTVLSYSLHLYFDFCGYSNMAIGLGLMVGLKFPENFASPYLATSLNDFWRRWHISLSSWLRDYLYIPLGGNRSGETRTAINLLTTMALGGLWHGASWTFLVWGLWHGIGLVVARFWSRLSMPKVAPLPGHALTLIFVMLGWALFRAQDWEGARAIFSGLGGHNGIAFTADFLANTRPVQIVTIALGIGLVYLPTAVRAIPRLGRLSAWPPFALSFPLWILSIWLIQTRSVIPFLYFQF